MDRFSTSSIAHSNVTALYHELIDDAVEGNISVGQGGIRSGTQGSEAVGR